MRALLDLVGGWFKGWPRPRQRRAPSSNHRIHLARYKHREIAGMPDASCDVRRPASRAEIKIGSRQSADRASRVLRDHQMAVLVFGIFAIERQRRLDEEWRAVNVDRFVDRDRSQRRERHALRTNRLLMIG